MTSRLSRRVLTSLLPSLLLALLLTPAPGPAADWPQWGGRGQRNMVSDETGLPDTFLPRHCGNGKAGLIRSRRRTSNGSSSSARPPTAIPPSPTAACTSGTDDMNLAGDERLKRTRGGLVQCFDEATGKLLWRLAVPLRTKVPPGLLYSHQHLGVCSSPTVDGDRVYVVTCAAEVVCLDADGLADGNDGPFVDEGQYMAGTDAPAVKLDATATPTSFGVAT